MTLLRRTISMGGQHMEIKERTFSALGFGLDNP
jgi:hypothetical protein